MPRTHSWAATAGLILATLALSACNQTPEADPVPDVPTPLAVTVTRTGGIAGVNQQVIIEPTGAWSYTDQRAGMTDRGQLTAAQLDDLSVLVRDPELVREAAKKPDGQCNDAFSYTVSAGELRATFEDCGQNDRPALDELLKFVKDTTAL